MLAPSILFTITYQPAYTQINHVVGATPGCGPDKTHTVEYSSLVRDFVYYHGAEVVVERDPYPPHLQTSHDNDDMYSSEEKRTKKKIIVSLVRTEYLILKYASQP